MSMNVWNMELSTFLSDFELFQRQPQQQTHHDVDFMARLQSVNGSTRFGLCVAWFRRRDSNNTCKNTDCYLGRASVSVSFTRTCAGILWVFLPF